MDPTADATASIATTLRDNLYEGLVRLDGSGKLLGSLAKSWDVSPDGTVVTFHLVSGAKWHDGTPFTAQDVKFSWDRAADANTQPPNPHRDYWAPVTVHRRRRTTRPSKSRSARYSDNWLFHMAAGSACIVSSKSAATNTTNPIGTGPFKFGNWNRGASLALTRNDDYWGNKAKLTDVEFRFISDGNAMNNALKAGDIDVIGQVGALDQVAPVPAGPELHRGQGRRVGQGAWSRSTRPAARWPTSACARRCTRPSTARPGSTASSPASPCRSAATPRPTTASRITPTC